jgi:FMN-dependent oxidoreductase (nitrilotriacetate monooxygenase family)
MTGHARPLRFNAFVMNTASHIQHGQWRRPDARQHEFNDVDLWIEVAQTLERGAFDALFFADVVGVYGPVGGDYTVNAREGLQLPNNDPSVLLGALATHTTHLGLAFTSSILQAHPFEFARRVSTLDHISRGRVAWNIVTSYQENAARNFGLDRLGEHDGRYDQAAEYLDVVYKLWEGSWDDDALRQDKAGAFSEAAGIHRISHEGEYYRVEGPHLSAPSPQRTPFLFQAGSSPKGRQFAGTHAEAQFVGGSTPEQVRAIIDDTRDVAVAAGRGPGDILFYVALSFIVGSTEEEARRLEREYDEYASEEAFLAHANLGVAQDDGTPYPPDTLLRDITTNGNRSTLASVTRGIEGREATVRDLGVLTAQRHVRVVGTPDQIADQLEGWRAAGVDGVNVVNWVLPGSYTDFVDHVTPVLQKRGLQQREYTPGSLREKLTGSARTNERHPSARYRGAFRKPARPGG